MPCRLIFQDKRTLATNIIYEWLRWSPRKGFGFYWKRPVRLWGRKYKKYKLPKAHWGVRYLPHILLCTSYYMLISVNAPGTNCPTVAGSLQIKLVIGETQFLEIGFSWMNTVDIYFVLKTEIANGRLHMHMASMYSRSNVISICFVICHFYVIRLSVCVMHLPVPFRNP